MGLSIARRIDMLEVEELAEARLANFYCLKVLKTITPAILLAASAGQWPQIIVSQIMLMGKR